MVRPVHMPQKKGQDSHNAVNRRLSVHKYDIPKYTLQCDTVNYLEMQLKSLDFITDILIQFL